LLPVRPPPLLPRPSSSTAKNRITKCLNPPIRRSLLLPGTCSTFFLSRTCGPGKVGTLPKETIFPYFPAMIFRQSARRPTHKQQNPPQHQTPPPKTTQTKTPDNTQPPPTTPTTLPLAGSVDSFSPPLKAAVIRAIFPFGPCKVRRKRMCASSISNRVLPDLAVSLDNTPGTPRFDPQPRPSGLHTF